MNMPKFTPGPWEVSKVYGQQGLIVALGGEAIASVTGYYTRAGQTEGNARLIAAAPELYEALCELLEWGREHTSPRDANSPHELLVKASAALAKVVQP